MTSSSEPQFMQALRRADEIRLRQAQVRNALKQGRITLAEALERKDLGSMTVYTLLHAQHYWGRRVTLRALSECEIPETRQVRDLTEAERAELLDWDQFYGPRVQRRVA